MIRATLLLSCVLLTTSGCARVSESRFNPLNWFGPSTAAPQNVAANGDIRPLVPENRQTRVVDGRSLVQTVTALSVDRTPSGAIVRATAINPTTGYYNAQLVNSGIENGVLTLDFRAQAPTGPLRDGPARARSITAAYALDSATLNSIRSVRVQGTTNARTAAR